MTLRKVLENSSCLRQVGDIKCICCGNQTNHHKLIFVSVRTQFAFVEFNTVGFLVPAKNEVGFPVRVLHKYSYSSHSTRMSNHDMSKLFLGLCIKLEELAGYADPPIRSPTNIVCVCVYKCAAPVREPVRTPETQMLMRHRTPVHVCIQYMGAVHTESRDLRNHKVVTVLVNLL